jgi:hypothetical protein
MSAEDTWDYARCRERIALLQGCPGFPDTGFLEFLGLRLDIRSGHLTTGPDDMPIPGLNAVVYCILATYSRTAERPEAFRLVSFRELPGGPAYEAAFRTRAILPLASRYSRDPRAFSIAVESPGGVPVAYADHACKLCTLSRVPVCLLIWEGSDEFPPSADLLFDASAPSYPETEASAMLGELVTQKIAFSVKVSEKKA